MSYHYTSSRPADTGLGWSCQLRRTTPPVVIGGRTIVPARPVVIGAEGHEVITRDAIGPTRTIAFTVSGAPTSHTLTPTDVADILLGNRSVDLGTHDADDSGAGVRSVMSPAEQRRHSLRATRFQAMPAALTDIRTEFSRLHSAILAERDPRRRMRLIGVTLHLIQDSYSPAHTDRNFTSNACIRYVRNYGVPLPTDPAGREHGVPSDDRDSITHAPSATARAQATDKSRRYLQIILKALRGGPAGIEASMEIGNFMLEVFRAC